MRSCIIIALAVAGLAGATGTAVADLPEVPLLGPAQQADGGWRIQLEDGSTVYTHGPDNWDSRNLFTLYGGGDKGSVSCAGAGQKRFEAIYARPVDTPDRYSEIAPRLRQAVYDASGYIDLEAKRLAGGAAARLRVACDAGGDMVVRRIVTRRTKKQSLATIIYDLNRDGLAQPDRKYVVFFDGCIPFDGDACFHRGLAVGLDRDDRLSEENLNNQGGADYAMVFANDAYPEEAPQPNWYFVIHEVAHVMGAVQPSAPHSTGAWHCTDGLDLMCYDDGGPRGHEYDNLVCPIVTRFECLGDRGGGTDALDSATGDYFHPAPAPGSYLSGHWNLAARENQFVDHETRIP